jgi:hypothetical protein
MKQRNVLCLPFLTVFIRWFLLGRPGFHLAGLIVLRQDPGGEPLTGVHPAGFFCNYLNCLIRRLDI